MKMKVLVAFYSRTGNARKVAMALSRILGCDSEDIIDTRDRSGVFGFLCSGLGAMLKSLTVLKELKHDPASYDMVIIGTPIWTGTLSIPVRTYIVQNMGRFKKVAFFCTMGGSSKTTFNSMEDLCGRKPAALLEVKEEEVANGQYINNVERFAEQIEKSKYTGKARKHSKKGHQ